MLQLRCRALIPIPLNRAGATPAEADLQSDPTGVVAKEFHTAAARVIMKGMYVARMARPDRLRTIASLARFLTTWSDDMYKRLRRLMAYIPNSLASRMHAWSGDSATGSA